MQRALAVLAARASGDAPLSLVEPTFSALFSLCSEMQGRRPISTFLLFSFQSRRTAPRKQRVKVARYFAAFVCAVSVFRIFSRNGPTAMPRGAGLSEGVAGRRPVLDKSYVVPAQLAVPLVAVQKPAVQRACVYYFKKLTEFSGLRFRGGRRESERAEEWGTFSEMQPRVVARGAWSSAGICTANCACSASGRSFS